MRKQIDLAVLSDEELLELRLCELPIAIAHTDIESWIKIFYNELDQKGITLRPPVYLADEWLCPEGVPAIGVPFYLAHPRLKALENTMMLDVEGSEQDEFMRLIRHEMGHAISYAYRLQQKKRWRELFGHPTAEERPHYQYKKYSKRFVHNLENFYAQSHPDEDFAETFAVWLNPQSLWQERYRRHPVFKKLEYVDFLMNTYKNTPSKVPMHDIFFNSKRLRSKIKTIYRKKKRLYAADYPDYFDEELLKIFSLKTETADMRAPSARKLLQTRRSFLVQIVSRWSLERKYVADFLVRRFSERARTLQLVCRYPEPETLAHLVACMTTMVKSYSDTAQFKEE